MTAKKHQMFIAGKWVDAAGGEAFEDMDPYIGEVYALVPAGTREDAKAAIAAAKEAFPEWASTPPGVRFGGQAALDEFTELRWINVQRVPRTFP